MTTTELDTLTPEQWAEFQAEQAGDEEAMIEAFSSVWGSWFHDEPEPEEAVWPWDDDPQEPKRAA